MEPQKNQSNGKQRKQPDWVCQQLAIEAVYTFGSKKAVCIFGSKKAVCILEISNSHEKLQLQCSSSFLL
jgi:hypothetical protein